MYKTVGDQQKTLPKNNKHLNQKSMASQNFVVKKRKRKVEICVKISIYKELSLAPETSVIPMKSWWKWASCHKEFRSRRVIAVGVNSIWEEIYVRKIIPPGFVMILLKERLDCYCCQTNPKPCCTKVEGSFQSLKGDLFCWYSLKLQRDQLEDTRVVLKLLQRTSGSPTASSYSPASLSQ